MNLNNPRLWILGAVVAVVLAYELWRDFLHPHVFSSKARRRIAQRISDVNDAAMSLTERAIEHTGKNYRRVFRALRRAVRVDK